MITNSVNSIKQLMIENQSLVCCGLDPDLRKFPSSILGADKSDTDKVIEFLKVVIEITSEHVCAFKAQRAFFDLLPDGDNVLKEIIHFVHSYAPRVPIIVDCKIGDIDNTMNIYLKNASVDATLVHLDDLDVRHVRAPRVEGRARSS